eukprot:1708802-Pyramimonas_sp.AAC.1
MPTPLAPRRHAATPPKPRGSVALAVAPPIAKSSSHAVPCIVEQPEQATAPDHIEVDAQDVLRLDTHLAAPTVDTDVQVLVENPRPQRMRMQQEIVETPNSIEWWQFVQECKKECFQQ